MKERIKYLDVAKGILILLVVIGHIDLVLIGWNPVVNENYYFNIHHNYAFVYTAFFMPAFFMITGMCSNFNKKLSDGIINDVKTLFIPAMIAEIAFDVIGNNMGCLHHITHFVLYGTGGWFFAALFVDKTIMRFIVKYVTNKKYLFASFLFPVFAFATYRTNDDIWSYSQAMAMMPYLVMGHIIRPIDINKTKTFACIFIYIILISLLFLINTDVPIVAHSYGIYRISQIPIHLMLSVTGSIGLIGLCKIIQKAALLEYFGRNSLIVYLYHLWFLQMFVPKINDIIVKDNNIYMSSVIFFGILSLTILFCLIINTILSSRYMQWSLGKF